MPNEIVAMALEEVAECQWGLPDTRKEKLLARAKALRSTPSPTPAGGLELFTRRFSTLSDEGEGAACYRYEPIPEAVAVIRLAKNIGYINGRKGHYGDHCAYEKVIREDLAKEWNEALSALDNRLNPKVES